MVDDFKLPGDVPKHVAEQLIGKSWGELEVLEHSGYLLFPDSIYKRAKSGEFVETKVALRVPKQHEVRKARTMAREIGRQDGLDPELDKDLIEDLETVCLLSMSIRSPSSPHEPLVPDPLDLEKAYDKTSLIQAWAKIDALTTVIDPAPHAISADEMFAMVAAIAKDRSISPLAVYASDLRNAYIITTAELLMSLLASRSSSEQSEPSIQDS